MKTLSRLASPGGFGLVLLLFLFLPFLSVSCEVPGMGSIGADYNGAQLAVGEEPEVEIPEELQDMTDELPAAGSSPESPPDPGVEVLAIIAAVVLAVGIALPFIPRLRDRVRLFGGAGVAFLGGVMLVITQVVAHSNLTSTLQGDAQSLSDDEISTPDIDSMAEELIHTGIGFWLCLVGLVLIALLSVGAVFRDKILPRPAFTGAGAGESPPSGEVSLGGLWGASSATTDEPTATAPTDLAVPSDPSVPADPSVPDDSPMPDDPRRPTDAD